MSVAVRGSALVAPAALAAHAGQWIPVDCRFNLAKPAAGREAYAVGHIPGAFYAHLDEDLSAPRRPGTGRHPLPDPADLRRLFARWGVEAGTRVVAYDDAGGAVAARLWWLLRWMGHDAASLLDGGLRAWLAEGRPLSTTVPPPGSGTFRGEPGHMPTIAVADVVAGLAQGSLLLLDARAPARFAGREEAIDPVAGHVPGAVNVPFVNSLGEGGRFRDPAALRGDFAAALAGTSQRDRAVMCGSGVTACHAIFAMTLAGLPTPRLYVGSWSEWIADRSRPVATG